MKLSRNLNHEVMLLKTGHPRAGEQGEGRTMGITTAKVTSKGQLTVPQAVRQFLSIQQGDEIMFIPDGKRIVIERLPGKVPSGQVFGRLHRSGARPLDIEQARAEARNARTKRYAGPDGNGAK